ncbi:MAG TPA: glycine zipper 2TM domain-containing protein, partial [Noviherbaspirillum sp.]|nr:glycine zipper 2TM domain-containing protein [Noviherbaspirillum sp.]
MKTSFAVSTIVAAAFLAGCAGSGPRQAQSYPAPYPSSYPSYPVGQPQGNPYAVQYGTVDSIQYRQAAGQGGVGMGTVVGGVVGGVLGNQVGSGSGRKA